MKESFSRGIYNGCVEKEKLERLSKDYRFANVLWNGVSDLINIVEDCYIENCLCLDYPRQGNVVRGLETGNLIKFFTSISTLELEEKVMKGEMLLPDAFNWLLQIRDCLGYVPKDYDKCKGPIHQILSSALDKALPICEAYKLSNYDHKKEICQLIDIYVSLFPDPQELNSNEENQNGDSEENQNSDGGSNDSIIKSQKPSNQTDEARQDAKKNSGQSSDNMFRGNMNSAKRNPSKERTEEAQKEAQAEADKARDNAKKNSVEDEDVSKKVAQETANEQEAKSQANELQNIYDEAKRQSLTRTGCYNTDVSRETVKATFETKQMYNEIYKKIEKTAKTCIRKVGQILNKREYDEEESGFVQGFKFNAHEAYRKDKKVFSKQITPDSKPDVAFTIMVDESGSMYWGNKFVKAREAAILFDAISRGLDIPTQIVGHTEHGNPLAKLYRNFNSNEKEKYALTKIDADGGNIDTVILTGLCEQILARPEDKKVVIVISDGAPCRIEDGIDKPSFHGVPLKENLNCKNGGDYAMKELNACVRYYRKKGIKVIGIAIDDLEEIKAIYEEGTLDCTNLDKLPNELVKIFKRYVLK